MNKFKNYWDKLPSFLRQPVFLVILFLLLGCLFIFGLPGRGILYFGDVQASYIFHPERVYGNINLWQDLYNSGSMNFIIFQNFLFSLAVLLSNLLLPITWHSYLYTFLGYFLFSLSGYFLFRRLISDRFAAFIIAVFFLTSPMVYVYNSSILLLYSLAFINFAFIYLHRIFVKAEEKRILYKEIFLAAIFFTLANIYLQNFFFIIYLSPFFLVFFFRTIWQHGKYYFTCALLLSFTYIMLNFFWIFILVYQIFHGGEGFVASATQQSSGMDVANLITKLTSMVNFFRLVPYNFSDGDDPLVAYNTNLFLMATSYIIALIAFAAMQIKDLGRYKKNVLLAITIFIVFFPILVGNKPPFQALFMYFWENVPFAKTFRTFTKLMFVMLYSFSYLLGVSIVLYKLKYKHWLWKAALIILVTTPIIIYNTPVLRQRSFTQNPLPNYYANLKEKYSEPLAANTMLTPQTNWLVTYNWREEKKDTDNLLPFFYNGRVLTNGASYEQLHEYQNFNNQVAAFIVNNQMEKLGYLFSLKNVGFLLHQNEIGTFLDFNNETKSVVQKNIMGANALLQKADKFGEITIYELSDKYYNPPIFSPAQTTIITRLQKGHDLVVHSPFIIAELLSSHIKTTDQAILFSEQNATGIEGDIKSEKKILFSYKDSISLDYSNPENSPKIQSVTEDRGMIGGEKYEDMTLNEADFNQAQIEFKKASAVQYEVVLHKAKAENVPILFGETFNSGWEIYPAKWTSKNSDKALADNGTPKIKQATWEEITKFQDQGLLSDLGEEFISKDYKKSIQNDNIHSTGKWTLLKEKPIEARHYNANGFSNFFVVDPEQICNQQPDSCQKNLDGSYEVRLVIFLSPQKYFYFSLLVSLSAWIISIALLLKSFFFNKDSQLVKDIK